MLMAKILYLNRVSPTSNIPSNLASPRIMIVNDQITRIQVIPKAIENNAAAS